jgi:hypothetical protein
VLLESLPLLVLLTLAQAPKVADTPPVPRGPAEPLLAYQGEEVAMRYGHGALDRAVHVSRRLDLIVAEMRGSLGVLFPLTAIVLSRDEWEREGLSRAYGLPQPISVGSVAVPASGDMGTVRRWRTWLGTDLPDIGGVPLSGTMDDASSLMLSDIVLQVEVCELIFGRTPAATADPWIRGLLSHLAAISLWSQFEPHRMPEIELMWSRVRGVIPALLELEPRRIEKGGPPLVAERWLLSESHLFDGAARAYAAGGPKVWKKLLKTMVKEDKPPTREQLVAVYPSLAEWLESLPPEAGIL